MILYFILKTACNCSSYLFQHQAGLLTEQLTLSCCVSQSGAPHPGLLQGVQLDSVEQRLKQTQRLMFYVDRHLFFKML